MIKIIAIVMVIVILFSTYCLCYTAKCADLELEELQKLKEKIKDEKV